MDECQSLNILSVIIREGPPQFRFVDVPADWSVSCLVGEHSRFHSLVPGVSLCTKIKDRVREAGYQTKDFTTCHMTFLKSRDVNMVSVIIKSLNSQKQR